MRKKIKLVLKIVAILIIVFFLAIYITQRPSHNREWEVGMEQLPYIAIDTEGQIEITNFRNFDWYNEGGTDGVYETRNFILDEMETVDVLISHFDDFEGLAHIFLSFGFKDGEHIVISLETRREQDETFSPVMGVLRQFEIIYVVGSEEDIIGLRTDVRDERVYLYPTIATPEKARELFLSLTADINDVYAKPRIYNTLTHNCTNEITRRVEDISDYDFPLTWKTILPGYFDEILYDMELINGKDTFIEMKESHLIDNESVDRYQETYSNELRSGESK